MNNKPVAWIDKNTGKPRRGGFIQTDYDFPFLAPSSEKLKSDLKITMLRFLTEAILRKAQSNCNGFCGKYECKENQTNCKRKNNAK